MCLKLCVNEEFNVAILCFLLVFSFPLLYFMHFHKNTGIFFSFFIFRTVYSRDFSLKDLLINNKELILQTIGNLPASRCDNRCK